MSKIRSVSLFFLGLLGIMFLSMVLAHFYAWLTITPGDRGFFSAIPSLYQGRIYHAFSLNTKIAGFFVSSIPLAFELAALYFLMQLFRLYSKAIIFSEHNVRYIRNTGYALLLQQIITPLTDFALGYILTAVNPKGMHFAILEMTEKNIAGILMAVCIILISWVMAEGAKLEAEQAFTV